MLKLNKINAQIETRTLTVCLKVMGALFFFYPELK